MKIPALILKQMYTLGSLENVEDGVRFSLKNRLSNATVTRLTRNDTPLLMIATSRPPGFKN